MSDEKVAPTRESKLTAELKEFVASPVIMLVRELLNEKLNKYKDRLVQHEDPVVRGKAQECIDLLKLMGND